MVMQIFATLLFGGFVAVAVVGHVALFHAMFFRAAQPLPQVTGRHLRLVPIANRAELARERVDMQAATPALRIA
jgi:hypothetical protein